MPRRRTQALLVGAGLLAGLVLSGTACQDGALAREFPGLDVIRTEKPAW